MNTPNEYIVRIETGNGQCDYKPIVAFTAQEAVYQAQLQHCRGIDILGRPLYTVSGVVPLHEGNKSLVDGTYRGGIRYSNDYELLGDCSKFQSWNNQS